MELSPTKEAINTPNRVKKPDRRFEMVQISPATWKKARESAQVKASVAYAKNPNSQAYHLWNQRAYYANKRWQYAYYVR